MELVGLRNLCKPAMLYFLLSFTIIIVVALQNIGSGYNYCVGTQSCPTQPSLITALFVIKILYVLLWTWLLNILCSNGYETVSWVLVLIPIVLMFIFMALFVSNVFDFARLYTIPNIFN